jgi:hypothetical protein
MTFKVLALLLLSGSLATADDRIRPVADDLETAIANERDAATREWYSAQLTTIAERDIVTAQIVRDMAQSQWDAAVRTHRADDAGRWANRHFIALRDERDAQARAARYARERDQARADFQVSGAEVRRLDAKVRRLEARRSRRSSPTTRL